MIASVLKALDGAMSAASVRQVPGYFIKQLQELFRVAKNALLRILGLVTHLRKNTARAHPRGMGAEQLKTIEI